MSSLETKLRNSILLQASRRVVELKVIIMHPTTADDLIAEIQGFPEFASPSSYGNLKYENLKVYRSFDVAEGEFKIF